MAEALSPTMTPRAFENGYWHLEQLKTFAERSRYINFVAEFLAAHKGVTRAEAIAAWVELKELDVPKDYASWVKARVKR
jgi:hypothetical protein